MSQSNNVRAAQHPAESGHQLSAAVVAAADPPGLDSFRGMVLSVTLPSALPDPGSISSVGRTAGRPTRRTPVTPTVTNATG